MLGRVAQILKVKILLNNAFFKSRNFQRQDTLKEFLDGTRPEDRGTLQQLQSYLGLKGTASDMLKNGNQASEFMLVILSKFSFVLVYTSYKLVDILYQ